MVTVFSKKAENVCRFTGKLQTFDLQLVGDNQYILGKGVLFLPDPDNESIGQGINIMCWMETAERLSVCPIGSWVAVFGSYMPNTYRGHIQDFFNITGFTVV